MRRPALACIVAVAAALAAAPAAGQLVADLSSDEIAITTGFAGTELLLFGAKEPGGDVVIVIRGPGRDEQVRRRERVAGIWVNGESVVFRGLPAFYHVAATRPLEDIAPETVLADRRIGARRLGAENATAAPAKRIGPFQEALIRNKTRLGLYGYDPHGVTVSGDRLFRTTVVFPANVPTGAYRVEIYLFRDRAPVSVRETTLVVDKVGLEAGVFNFAHQNAASYGAIAVVIALAFGWLAGLIFRS